MKLSLYINVCPELMLNKITIINLSKQQFYLMFKPNLKPKLKGKKFKNISHFP